MTAINRDVIGDKCIKNNREVLATSDQEKHLAWKEHCQRMLNEEFEWDKGNLSISKPSIEQLQIDKESAKNTLIK